MKNKIIIQFRTIGFFAIMLCYAYSYGQYQQMNKEPKGPDFSQNVVFPELGDSALDHIKKNFNIHAKIYKDKNSYSNIYYYLPREYTLKWNKKVNEYDFNIHYLSSKDNKRGDALISLALISNIKGEDIRHAEKLISQKTRKPVKLRVLSTYGEPKFDFQENLKLLNVHIDSVRISMPSDMNLPITTSWKMTTDDVSNFISAMLKNINTGGNITFQLDKEGDYTTSIPVNLKVNNAKTFGKIKFDTAEQFLAGWNNELDYPILPKSVMILSKRAGRNPITGRSIRISRNRMDEINFDGKTVAPTKKFTLSDRSIVDRISKMAGISSIWMDYDVEGCEECDQIVKRKLIGGTSGSEISTMEVQVLNALEFSEANAIQVHIKSKQADPNGVNEIELPPIQILEDGQTISDIQLFVPQGETLAYDYRVLLVMDTGKTHKSRWMKGNSNLLVLAEKQIKKLFPDKKKDEIIENAKNGAIEKLKDTVLGKDVTEEELIDKGISLISGLFKKKDSTKVKGQEEKKKDNEQPKDNEDLKDDGDTSENSGGDKPKDEDLGIKDNEDKNGKIPKDDDQKEIPDKENSEDSEKKKEGGVDKKGEKKDGDKDGKGQDNKTRNK